MEHVTIEIPKMYYDVLSKWASVGRTIDAAVKLLDQYVEALPDNPKLTDVQTNMLADATDHVIEELRDLKQSLDACNAACKSKRMAQLLEEIHKRE